MMNSQLEHNSFKKTAFQGGFFVSGESGAADLATTGGGWEGWIEEGF